ncbi:prephenate dehydratase [Botrimarina mediterranea]|uniref:Bifunctional chorismate mutase/prephenate dehydratase n=1 Tax=Botrimarina mediterranea TaxID=2528022 RepID=A0A518K5N2_9BACT|nr:prephenate dehydratase [Botrimarina mediterranea]QDV73085.1 Prephenate dehydratase [Botrimarina mediterranea]
MAKKAAPKTTPTGGAKALRTRIRVLDRQIADAVAERTELVARLVAQHAQLKNAPADIAATTVAAGKGTVSDDAMRAVFREVVAASRAAIGLRRIAYLGPEDSYSHLTAIERFGEAADLVPVATIHAVFQEVSEGSCELGVVPLENSTHGRVTDTLEAFASSMVHICGEAPMRIHHCLLGQGPRSAIRRVVSKPQALAQCSHWLAEHLPGVEAVPYASTSDAARLAAEDPSVAAIASEQAGRRHGLEPLARHIEDQKDNVTRFAVIGPVNTYPTGAPKTGDDKTALMFELAHEPGALADGMAIFKRQKLNLTWIESFPIPGSRTQDLSGGRYLFFVELMGHQADLRVRRAVASLGKKCLQLRVLGSYARAKVLG